MKVIKKSDELRFNEEEINILREARKLVGEVLDNIHDDGNVDGWYEDDFDNVCTLLNTLANGAYIGGEYCVSIDYD